MYSNFTGLKACAILKEIIHGNCFWDSRSKYHIALKFYNQ